MIHQSLFISIQNSPTRILIVFLKYIQVQDMKKMLYTLKELLLLPNRYLDQTL